MKRVFKYELPWGDHADIGMPLGAEILSVGVQQDRLMLWALVDDEQSIGQCRSFRIAGTGHPLGDDAMSFIGTVFSHGGALVFHIFEETE